MKQTILKAYKAFRNMLYKSNNKPSARAYLLLKLLERQITSGNYSFVTLDELFLWTEDWIKSFPETYDLIVGIPRSGLLVANIIALKLGKPLTTPELLIQDKNWMSKCIKSNKKIKHVLLVDDSITGGKTMIKYLKLIKSHNKNLKITTAALIATKESKSQVDLNYKVIYHPRLFEWNLLHSPKGIIATDLDGVLCENCPEGTDSNEEKYLVWIKTAKPYLIPAFEIDTIISCRLEKYRVETEHWLKKNKVKYKKLVLWNLLSKQERMGKNAKYKISELLRVKPDMFFESSKIEAARIWMMTTIPTLCVDEMVLFD